MATALRWFFGIIFLGVLKWAFDHFAWDALVQVLENNFRIKEADVITSVSSFVIPSALAFGALAGTYWLGKYHQPPPAIPASRRSRPTVSPSVASVKQTNTPYIIQSLLILIFAAGGVGYSFSYLSTTYELSDNNADIQVTRLEAVPPKSSDDTLQIHFFMKNTGGATARNMAHTGNEFATSNIPNTPLPDYLLDARFAEVRKNLRSQVVMSDGGTTVERGEEFYYTYVSLPNIGDQTAYAKILSNSVRLYVIIVMIYRDNHIPKGKFIVTEKCWYFLPTGALAKCEHHNETVVE
jgi:hypothetical protein